jgi:hypothetical protein
MKGIIHITYSNAFYIFLSWFIVHLSYKWGRYYVKLKTEKRYTDILLKDKIFACVLWFMIPALIAVGIFFIRTHGGEPTIWDCGYSLTAFVIIFFPAYAGLFIEYYKYVNK